MKLSRAKGWERRESLRSIRRSVASCRESHAQQKRVGNNKMVHGAPRDARSAGTGTRSSAGPPARRARGRDRDGQPQGEEATGGQASAAAPYRSRIPDGSACPRCGIQHVDKPAACMRTADPLKFTHQAFTCHERVRTKHNTNHQCVKHAVQSLPTLNSQHPWAARAARAWQGNLKLSSAGQERQSIRRISTTLGVATPEMLPWRRCTYCDADCVAILHCKNCALTLKTTTRSSENKVL